MRSPPVTPTQRLYVVARGGLATWGLLLSAYLLVNQTVLLMRPDEDTWCRGPGYVQAEMVGFKIHNRRPVFDSAAGQADAGRGLRDTLFSFPNDPTPYSSRPKYSDYFGIWRWHETNAQRVVMTMLHTDNGIDYPASYGPYDVPANIPACPPEGENG